MTRAARRRQQRATQKAAKKGGNAQALDLVDKTDQIKLENPVAKFFEQFIIGNATKCERVVEHDSKLGKTVAICGAGPSLRDHLDELDTVDDVWGCNSAVTWLAEQGHRVTHGFTIDQTPAMLTEWKDSPVDLEYLVASSVHPHLTDMMIDRGSDLRFFHNFVGLKKPPVVYCRCGHDDFEHVPVDVREKLGHFVMHSGLRIFQMADGMTRDVMAETVSSHLGKCRSCAECDCYEPGGMSYEDWLYQALYPITMRAGSGLNAVSRAIDLAWYMGYETIKVLGADCALRLKSRMPEGLISGSEEHMKWLREETEMHADGGNALRSGATAVTLGGEIDGVWWETKPDLAITAIFLVKMAEKMNGRLVLIGDTLPNALKGKSDEFLARLPNLTDSEGNPVLPQMASLPG